MALFHQNHSPRLSKLSYLQAVEVSAGGNLTTRVVSTIPSHLVAAGEKGIATDQLSHQMTGQVVHSEVHRFLATEIENDGRPRIEWIRVGVMNTEIGRHIRDRRRLQGLQSGMGIDFHSERLVESNIVPRINQHLEHFRGRDTKLDREL